MASGENAPKENAADAGVFFHGLGVESLWATVVSGLRPGPSPGRGGHIGIYVSKDAKMAVQRCTHFIPSAS